MRWPRATLEGPRVMLMDAAAEGCCSKKTDSGLQPENCERMINGDERDGVCFAQSLIQLIEVQGKKLDAFLE